MLQLVEIRRALAVMINVISFIILGPPNIYVIVHFPIKSEKKIYFYEFITGLKSEDKEVGGGGEGEGEAINSFFFASCY